MIRPITRDEILNGLGQAYYCYMFGANRHEYKCDMWVSIFDEVGGIGFLAREGRTIAGQMIFIPKKYARRIAIPTSPEKEGVDTTMVIGCLYVLQDCGGRGIASAMIQMLLEFCGDRGYRRVEACVHPGTPEEAGMHTSFYPFRKFGFILNDSPEGWEFRPQTRMCYLDLRETGEQVAPPDRRWPATATRNGSLAAFLLRRLAPEASLVSTRVLCTNQNTPASKSPTSSEAPLLRCSAASLAQDACHRNLWSRPHLCYGMGALPEEVVP